MGTSETASQMLTTKQLAAALGVTVQYVNRIAAMGLIPATTEFVGKRPERRYDRELVVDALAEILFSPEPLTQETRQ